MEKLTHPEEQVMRIIWQTDGGFIRDFFNQMEPPVPPYTTLASTVTKLEKKGYLEAKKVGSMKFFKPAIAEDYYKKHVITNYVNSYFKDSFKELVTFFAKEKKIDSKELQDIINLIENPNVD